MSLSRIVRVVAVAFFIPAVVFGVYIISHGEISPGGGFQGGAIIATALALLLIAFGEKKFKKAISKKFLYAVVCLGLIGFISVAFLGLNASFFHNFLANSNFLFGEEISFGPNAGHSNVGGTIPVMNYFVGLGVASALIIIVITMYEGWEKSD